MVSAVFPDARIRPLEDGASRQLPRLVADLSAEISAPVLAQVEQALSCSATGSPETVRRQLAALVARYQPEELMVTGMIHDHAARLWSFEIASEALSDIAQASEAA